DPRRRRAYRQITLDSCSRAGRSRTSALWSALLGSHSIGDSSRAQEQLHISWLDADGGADARVGKLPTLAQRVDCGAAHSQHHATSRTVSRYDFTPREAEFPCTTGAPKFPGSSGMEREGKDPARSDSRGKTTPRDAWGSGGNCSESTPKPKATGSNPVA